VAVEKRVPLEPSDLSRHAVAFSGMTSCLDATTPASAAPVSGRSIGIVASRRVDR
jgi:hypothetical protein